MKRRDDDYKRWLEGNRLTNTVLPLLTAAVFLGGVIYAVLKWLKIL